MVISGKKLLVLDLNGLLIDTYYEGETRPDRAHDAKVNKFFVYERPFCNEFIEFCLENFVVGIWSSALGNNVNSLVEYLFKDTKEKLAFVWHQQHCTDTGFRHPDNKFKPVFLKELWRLWTKAEPDLPWEAGDYGPENTLLIDDAPYKAINNPPHTAIFPKTYRATDLEDCYLDAELQVYLEGLLETSDVQKYLNENPIGERSIGLGDPQWAIICNSVKVKNERENRVPVHMVATVPPVPPDPIPASDRRKTSGKKFDQRIDRTGTQTGQAANGNVNPAKYSTSHIRGDPLTRRGAYEDSHWEQRPDLVVQVKGDYEGRNFFPSWRTGFPDGHVGPPWSRGPRSNETAYLGGISGNDPHLLSDWQRREGKNFGIPFDQRLDHIDGEQAANSNLGPLDFSLPHTGGDAHNRRLAYEDTSTWDRPGLVSQLKGDYEGRIFSASGLGGGFSESHAGPSWPPGTRANELGGTTIADPILSSDWRTDEMKFSSPFDQRLSHPAAQTVQAASGNIVPVNLNMPHVGGGALSRRGGHEDWERPSFTTQLKGDYESRSLAPLGWGSGICGSDPAPAWPPGPRANETGHGVGFTSSIGSDPILSSDWRNRSGKKFANSLEQRLDHGAAEAVQGVNGNSNPVNLGMSHIHGDHQTRRGAYEESQVERSGLPTQLKGNYESRNFTPSVWTSSHSEGDAGPSWSRGPRPPETSHIVGIAGSNPSPSSSDWKRRTVKNYADSFDQGMDHIVAETVQGANGNLVPANLSTPRIVGDAQTRRVSHEDGHWERPDLIPRPKGDYEGRGFTSSGWGSGLSDSHGGPFWSSRSRSNDTGHAPSGTTWNADYPSQKQMIGRPREYESLPRGGDRTGDDHLGREGYNRKRNRDVEDMGRGWSLERKDSYRGWTRGGARDNEDYHLGEDRRRGLSSEHKDSKRGRSVEFSRDGGRGPKDLGIDDRRVAQVNNDRSPVFRRRDRGLMREFEEPYNRPWRASPGHDYRREGSQGRTRTRDAREFQRFYDRDSRGHGDRFEDFRNGRGRGGERDDGKGFSRSSQKFDHLNSASELKSSKRRPI